MTSFYTRYALDLCLCSILFMVVGCATEPQYMKLDHSHDETYVLATPKVQPRAPAESSEDEAVPDFSRVQDILKMKRDVHELGFSARGFDSCQAGVKDADGKCGVRHMTLLNFRLLCRDSEDTTSEVVRQATPLVKSKVKWKLGELHGMVKTDNSGYGQIQILSQQSVKGKRLVMTVGKQFLGLEISEITRLVVPSYWCNQPYAAAD